MKILTAVAGGFALVALPILANAQDANTTSNAGANSSALEPGGISQQADLEEFELGDIPAEAYVAAGFVLIGATVIGVLVGNRDECWHPPGILVGVALLRPVSWQELEAHVLAGLCAVSVPDRRVAVSQPAHDGGAHQDLAR